MFSHPIAAASGQTAENLTEGCSVQQFNDIIFFQTMTLLKVLTTKEHLMCWMKAVSTHHIKTMSNWSSHNATIQEARNPGEYVFSNWHCIITAIYIQETQSVLYVFYLLITNKD